MSTTATTGTAALCATRCTVADARQPPTRGTEPVAQPVDGAQAETTLKRAISLALLLLYSAAASGFPWDKDMVDQPSAKPQESAAPPGPSSVPTEGGETLPAPTTEAGMFAAKDAAAALANPVPATEESVERGASLFAVNCAVCHGAEGRGDGPVGQLFDPPPVDLTDAYTQEQADGQIFFTLTRGRVAMPFYRDALSQRERWDVVNYIKQRFGSQ